jgi:hypothetical protein
MHTRMTLKKKGNDGYPAAQSIRLMQAEDTEQTLGSLGNSTSY